MAFFNVFRSDFMLARPEKVKSHPDVEEPDRPKILDNTKIRSIKPERKDGIFVYFGLLFIGSVVGYIAYEQLTSAKVAIFPSSREKDVPNTLSSKDKIFADPLSLEYKVSNFLLPLSYILYLSSDMSNTYSGTVTIKLKCIKDTSIVGLHSSQHIIGHIEVKAVDIKAIHVVSYSRKYNILMIMLKEKLISGCEYNVSISFHGNVTEGSKGLFFRKYQDGDGTKRTMLTGQFQFGRAKYVFPCLDDTVYKASFKITLQHKKMLTAISNMPVKRYEILPNGLVQTFFEISPMMSIDHVAFVVADLLYQEIVISSGLKVRLYAPKGRLNETNRAGQLTRSLIQYYQIMFGVDYLYKKLDFVPMVMLSSHTSFSPGLSILPEEAFLLNMYTATLTQAEASVLTIGQAVAKQVFPCMMDVDLRRNVRFIESLVIYLGYQAASYHYPMWGLLNQFYNDVTNMALNKDKNAGITFDSNHHSEMRSIHHDLKGKAFKGAALLNMISKYIGESKLHESIMLSCIPMLTQSGNTLTASLMDILLQNVLQADVDILKFWFDNVGFPLLSLSSGVAPSQYTLRQKPFIDINSTTLKAASFNWPVPVVVKCVSNSATKRLVLKEESGQIKLFDCYLQKVNSHGHGFYRVNYSNSDWENFVRVLNENHKKLSANDRANLISDAFEIARSNPQYISTALSLTQYLNKEHDYTPYKIALTQLKKLVNLFNDVKIGTYLQTYIEEKTQPVLNDLTLLNKHSHEQRKLIGLLKREAVLHHKIVRVRIENMFLRWVTRNTMYLIPKHLRELVFEVGIACGSSYAWNYLFGYFKKVPSVAEKDLALSGLSSTHNKFLLERLMEYSRKCDPSLVVCIQQRLTIWLKVCKNDHGGNVMAKKAFYDDWRYIQKNIEEIYDTIETFMLGCLGSGKFVSDNELLESIDMSSLAQSSKDLLGEVIDHINQNINLRRKEEDIGRWLKFKSSWT